MAALAHPRHTLVGESFGPFTQKARWALEFCGVEHTYQEYTPTLSEPGLRLRMRQWSGAVSVPVLFAAEHGPEPTPASSAAPGISRVMRPNVQGTDDSAISRCPPPGTT